MKGRFSPVATKNKHYIRAETDMKALGIFKPEFAPMIEVYSQLMTQYEALTKIFKKSGYQYEVNTSTGSKKAPIVTTLETLRKDILNYANMLGLTPLGLLKTNDKAFSTVKKSELEEALKSIGGNG